MIATNREKWEAEYPSDSPTITVLRAAVIRAEALALDSQFAFDGLHELLQETEIPPHAWPHPVYQCFQTLKRAAAADARHLARSLRTLQTAFAAHQSAIARLPPPQPEPEAPKPPAAPHKPDMMQIVRIKVENGQLRHKLEDFPWGKADRLADYRYVRRVFYFKDLQVPAAYDWVRTYNGFNCTDPCTSYTIFYTGEEFARITQREQDSGADLLLDGHRCGYKSDEFNPVFYAEVRSYDTWDSCKPFVCAWEQGWDW